MKIEDFLNKFIENYLIGDLRVMSELPKRGNGAGYPMVMSILAGMELLGGLLWSKDETFDVEDGNSNFLNYWDHYFVIQNPEYKNLGRLFRQLVRNGIGHTFVAKHGIFIEKGTGKKISIDLKSREIYIDCNLFYIQFKKSYDAMVKPITNGQSGSTTKDKMQLRLDAIATSYSAKSIKIFKNLKDLDPSLVITNDRASVPISLFTSLATANASGPSGPMGPIVPEPTIISSSTVNRQTTTLFTTPSGTLSVDQNG